MYVGLVVALTSNLSLRSLYSEALLPGCSCTERMFAISCCCDENDLLSCSITLESSSLSPTDPVLWCLMLAASLLKKSLKLLHFLALLGLSHQVSHGRLNNPVSLMENYAEQRIFFSVNVYSPASVDSLQSSMRVNSTAMVVLGYHCSSNAISFSCSFSRITVP